MRTAVAVRPCRPRAPGTEVRILVLAADDHGVMGVEVGSGVPVRARYPVPVDLRPAAFDVVLAPVAATTDLPDPCHPEAIELAEAPERIGHLGARRAERWLRPLVHPAGVPLLGFVAVAVPFWQLNGTRPSMALVPGRPTVVRTREGLRCRFAWRNLIHDLAMEGSGDVADARRLLVTLTAPRAGLCHKVVSALL
jgi:hypothetical protein